LFNAVGRAGGMKKIGLFLLAIVMVSGMAGCGDTDSVGDEPFDFSGSWKMVYTVTGNVTTPCGTTADRVGRTASATVVIVQDGAAITISGTVLNSAPDLIHGTYVGIADATEFNVTSARGAAGTYVMLGNKQGGNSIAGVVKAVCNGTTYDTALIAFSMNK
jgi:hypothetical protein